MSYKRPLYDKLKAFAVSSPLRMAMPGHKGHSFMPSDLTEIDFTELSETGDLYGSQADAISEAEQLWADAWNAHACLFLTGGSTQGIHTALYAALQNSSFSTSVIADRIAHRSFHTAMALLDLKPIWLTRAWLSPQNVAGAVNPSDIENALKSNPEAKIVFITSPTYYGVISDIDAIAQICHKYNATLIVDAAHAAHFFLFPELKKSFQNVDFFVVSAHKTLKCFGQTALLFSNNASLEMLKQASLIFATSSPSYIMMSALDYCRQYYCDNNSEYSDVARQVATLRKKYNSLQESEYLRLDPTRLVINVSNGFEVQRQLEQQNIFVEMADLNHIVLIITDADNIETLRRLQDVLDVLNLGVQSQALKSITMPELPKQILTPRQAMFSPTLKLSLEQAIGLVSAEQIAPYPPGVPIIAPGELIEQLTVDYLKKICYSDIDSPKNCIKLE